MIRARAIVPLRRGAAAALLVFFYGLSAGAVPPSEPPTVQAEVTPTEVKLGEVVRLTLLLRRPSAVAAQSPALRDSLGSFEVRASTQGRTEVQGDYSVDLFSAELQNFTTGQQTLPPIRIDYKDVYGKAGFLNTPEIQVTVKDVTPGPDDKGDIRGIKGVIGPTAWSPWWWAALLLLAGGAALWFWRGREKKMQGPPPPPPVPADVTALNRLKELQESGWHASGRIKEFYSALSEILRGYLEEGFKIPALERTTTELMRGVQKHPVSQSLRPTDLKEILENCDLVKFAKFQPDAGEALQAHAQAVRVIEQTRTHLPEPATRPERGEMPKKETGKQR